MNTGEDSIQSEQHLFTEEDLRQQYIEASRGQRFFNWFVDFLLMRYALSWAVGFSVGYILASFFPEFYLQMLEEEGLEYYFTIYIIWFGNHIIYYTFCEKVFRGYTMGKLLTGTRAIREDGTELRFKDALLRSLVRIVPFEAISGFRTPWHDSWTKTTVIKSR